MAKIKLRRDTYTNWYNANPILGLGEPSFDTTNKAFKVGDGLTVWRNLSYTSGVDTTKLPLSGGTLTGDLTGTNAGFASVSASNFYGNGSGLTNLTIGSFLSSSGGTLTGGLTGTHSVFSSISATKLFGDGSGLTGITSGGGGASVGSTIIGNGTITLVPDTSLSAIEESGAFGFGGQYLIVDPTSPNHIHLRAGGPIDEAAGQLILGGEKANVTVRNQTDSFVENHQVIVNTEDNNGNHYTWTFGPSGNIIFPSLQVDLHNGGVQTGQVLQFGNPDLQTIITGPTPELNYNAQRLILQGQRATGTGEGGDVYLWGGDSDVNGGDIKIYAGDSDATNQGYGGYVNITAGYGYTYGGDLELEAGNGHEQGGTVTIKSGTANVTNGVVNIISNNKTWTFNSNGNLSTPGLIVGSVISKDAGGATGSVAIDLTKQINKIHPYGNGAASQYTLADGIEGQVLHLVPTVFNSAEYTSMTIANARYKNSSNYIVQGEAQWWLPFGGDVGNSSCLVTLIFTDGYWNLPHSIFGS